MDFLEIVSRIQRTRQMRGSSPRMTHLTVLDTAILHP
jgi:hypothetical protein